MEPSEYLDFDDVLSHTKEILSFGEFELIEVISNEITDSVEDVFDLVVDKNRNYQVSNLGICHNGGKRKGAGTVALSIWHNDIMDFFEMQLEHGDIRLKSYDVFPQLVMCDSFMIRDEQERPWVTFCPFEVKNVLGIDVRGLYGDAFEEAYVKIEAAHDAGKLRVSRKHQNARDLMKLAMRPMFETGMPYIAFIDTINEMNPNKGDPETYGILNVNLCVESYSNTKPDVYAHVCNLCSINLSNIKDMNELARVARQSCRMLEYGIELTNNPTEITKNHNERFRTIGIGQMGMHDYLAKRGLTYKNLDVISEISECIEYNAVLESIELSKQYGPFKAFQYSQWASGEMTRRFKENGCGKYDWDYAQSQIDLYGMRHSQLTSPAPTTSTAIYQDCSSSYLPIFDTFFVDENNNGKLISCAKYLAKYPLGYAKTLPKFTAKEIIDITAAEQGHIDTGISMELLFDHNDPTFTAKTIWDAIHYAWRKKIKAIYYIRHIKKNEVAQQEEAACESCAS